MRNQDLVIVVALLGLQASAYAVGRYHRSLDVAITETERAIVEECKTLEVRSREVIDRCMRVVNECARDDDRRIKL